MQKQERPHQQQVVQMSMLFHNRSVKAAMGSVIVNGGVRLSGGKSLVIPNL